MNLALTLLTILLVEQQEVASCSNEDNFILWGCKSLGLSTQHFLIQFEGHIVHGHMTIRYFSLHIRLCSNLQRCYLFCTYRNVYISYAVLKLSWRFIPPLYVQRNSLGSLK